MSSFFKQIYSSQLFASLALRDNVLISQSQMTRGRADKLPTFSLRDAATVATTTAGRLITRVFCLVPTEEESVY